MKKLGIGAYVGTAVGFAGWLIGFAIVCAGAGETGILKEVALPGLALSLGAAACVLVTAETAGGCLGQGRAARVLLLGQVLFFAGLLTLIVNHWVAPLVDGAPDLKRAIEQLGGVYRVWDGVPVALMAAGTVMLALVLRRLRRPA